MIQATNIKWFYFIRIFTVLFCPILLIWGQRRSTVDTINDQKINYYHTGRPFNAFCLLFKLFWSVQLLINCVYFQWFPTVNNYNCIPVDFLFSNKTKISFKIIYPFFSWFLLQYCVSIYIYILDTWMSYLKEKMRFSIYWSLIDCFFLSFQLLNANVISCCCCCFSSHFV